MSKCGKFIVIYGINNLGKTTQANLLVDRMVREGKDALYLKYALYDLSPSGPIINNYLRPVEGRPRNPHNLSPREFHILQALNRTQYDEEVRCRLQSSQHIVA